MLKTLAKTIDKFPWSLGNEIKERILALPKKNRGDFGTDPFGFDPNAMLPFAPFADFLYRHYFRVETFGMNNLPSGRMMVIANHGGQIPIDGFMMAMAFMLEPDKPVWLRGMVERLSAEIPFISPLFARGGQIVGSPGSCEALLNNDEAVMVFPEGAKGILKLYSERYKLQQFGHGFMRLALQTKTPIVPVAIVGSEEQLPSIANLTPLAKLLGLPGFPLIFPHLLPLPLPTKYRIHVGKPLIFRGDGTEDDDTVADYVLRCQFTLQKMVRMGLQKREAIFS